MSTESPAVLLPGVRMWLCADWTDNPGSALEQISALSLTDRNRFLRFRPHAKREQFLRSRLLVRHVLESESNGKLTLAHADDGRPLAVDESGNEQLSITLSHSANLAAVAVAPRGRRIGIDVEVRTESELRDVASVALHGPEAEWLASLPATAQDVTMLQLWTAKEAIWKTGGSRAGISVPDVQLSFCETGLAPAQPQPWAPGFSVLLRCFGSLRAPGSSAVNAAHMETAGSCEFCGAVSEMRPLDDEKKQNVPEDRC